MPTELSKKILLTVGFSFAAGWADVISFMRYEAFAALMTGNAIKLGVVAATKDPARGVDTAFYACVIFSYIAGCVLFSEMKRRIPTRPSRFAAPVCFTLILASDVLYEEIGLSRWQLCLLAPAFGIQNSFTFGGALGTNTTIITGNLAKLGIAISKSLHCECPPLKDWVCPLCAVLAKIVAAIAGGFTLVYGTDMDVSWLFIPSGVILVICMLLHDLWLQGPAPKKSVSESPRAQTVLPGQDGFVDASDSV